MPRRAPARPAAVTATAAAAAMAAAAAAAAGDMDNAMGGGVATGDDGTSSLSDESLPVPCIFSARSAFSWMVGLRSPPPVPRPPSTEGVAKDALRGALRGGALP